MNRKQRLHLSCARDNSTPSNPSFLNQVYHTMPQLSPIHKLFLGQKSSDSSQSKYKRIVDIFKYSGGLDEAEIYLTHWGVSPTIKGLLLAYAEYDALIGGGV
jgi:hypothetical protein